MTEARRTDIYLDESEEVRRARLSQLARSRPYPLNSLVASAARITQASMKDRRGFGKAEAWQDDAWDMYDLVGEFRFVAATIASKMSQGILYVGKLNDDPTQPPIPLENDQDIAAEAFSYFGNTATQRAQMIERMGVNLFTPGDGYFVGIPRHLLPDYDGDMVDDDTVPLDDLDWRMLSLTEVSFSDNATVTLRLGDSKRDQLTTSPDRVMLIRVWRPHPRKWWLSDSPARATLPVLRELVSLTMHISAQTDSRLAGAGILVVPASARRAIATATGIDPDAEDDPFTEALMDAMMTALSDRASAAAVVPLVITVPDEATGLFQHITFSTPLDSEARNLRDEAIRRLALGLDAPPELLLGVGDMNHWGAWLVQEDVVASHIEPPLALICDAITTQYLHPVLIEQGMSREEAEEYVVWYDVSHLIQRPTRLPDAQALHTVGVISDDALREAGGFSDQDAPPNVNRSVEIAAQIAQANPALIDNLPEIVAAFEALFNPSTTNVTTLPAAPTEDVTTTPGTPTESPTEGGPPATDGTAEPAAPEKQPPASLAASGVTEVFAPGVLEDALARYFEKHPEALRALFATVEEPARSDSVCVMAIPVNPDDLPVAMDDEGKPQEPHATVAYFGHLADNPQFGDLAKQMIIEQVQSVARDHGPFVADVGGIEPLGDEGALVWMLTSPDLQSIFDAMTTGSPEVSDMYETAEGVTRYPEYQPHVTIGYDVPPSGDMIDTLSAVKQIEFDRLALWWGDERIEFTLGDGDPVAQDYSAFYERIGAVPVGDPGSRLPFADATPKDGDGDGFIDDQGNKRPDPLDAQDFAPATEEERAALKVPKAWTNVEANHAPGARVLARGTDAAGRRQALYSAEHTQAQAAAKFARMRALDVVIPHLDTLLKGDESDTAKALTLIRTMGLRPGSDRDTKAKVKAYGASNLLASHVQVDPSTGNVSLHFTGKKGVDINLPVTDPEVADMLRTQVAGKGPDDRLFDTNERKVNALLDQYAGPEFKVKDLRTYLANATALMVMSEMPAPANLTQFRKARLAVGKAVSARLGNTPAMALSAYINPAVFVDWEGNLKKGVND